MLISRFGTGATSARSSPASGPSRPRLLPGRCAATMARGRRSPSGSPRSTAGSAAGCRPAASTRSRARPATRPPRASRRCCLASSPCVARSPGSRRGARASTPPASPPSASTRRGWSSSRHRGRPSAPGPSRKHCARASSAPCSGNWRIPASWHRDACSWRPDRGRPACSWSRAGRPPPPAPRAAAGGSHRRAARRASRAPRMRRRPGIAAWPSRSARARRAGASS